MDDVWSVTIVAVVGIVATIGAPIWHERRRWRHEERQSLRRERTIAYADFLTAAEQSLAIARSFVSQQGLAWLVFADLRRHQLDTGRTLQDAARAVVAAMARVRLAGFDPAVDAAEELLVALSRAADLVQAQDRSAASWDVVIADLRDCRAAFVEACREGSSI
jgi:hypothetical protein